MRTTSCILEDGELIEIEPKKKIVVKDSHLSTLDITSTPERTPRPSQKRVKTAPKSLLSPRALEPVQDVPTIFAGTRKASEVYYTKLRELSAFDGERGNVAGSTIILSTTEVNAPESPNQGATHSLADESYSIPDLTLDSFSVSEFIYAGCQPPWVTPPEALGKQTFEGTKKRSELFYTYMAISKGPHREDSTTLKRNATASCDSFQNAVTTRYRLRSRL